MKELLSTDDPIELSYVQALLADASIECLVLDAATGALISFVVPPRIMVADDDWAEACAVLREAGVECP